MVPLQGVNVPLLVQTRPEQQAVVGEHCWPTCGHPLVWHVPLMQVVPEQQSEGAVQLAPRGLQGLGCWQVPLMQ